MRGGIRLLVRPARHAPQARASGGIPTIKKKTAFAMQNAGGVMIWELLEDAPDEKSLLRVVDSVANPGNR